jgi:hypothetical protein
VTKLGQKGVFAAANARDEVRRRNICRTKKWNVRK